MNATFSLKWLFVGTAVVALSAAALVNASWELNASLRSFYGGLLIVSAIVGIWRKNAFFGGVAVAGLLHSLNTLHDGLDRRLFSDNLIADLTNSGGVSVNYWQAVWAMLHTLWSIAVSLMGGLLAWAVDRRAPR